MTKEQFENFINAMMGGEHEEEDDLLFPNGDADDYREDVTEKIYQEL